MNTVNNINITYSIILYFWLRKHQVKTIFFMKTIAILNNKGGVAKTTTTANVGAYLAYLEHRVLLIDCDAQANLTQHFNFYDNIEKSLYNAFYDLKFNSKEAKLPIIKINDNLFLTPSENRLREIEDLLTTYGDPSRALKKLLKPFKDHFDYCLIDLPPSLGNLTKNAVFAADGVIIPIEAGQFSLNGVTNIVAYLEELKNDGDLDFDIIGAFMSKYDERKSISVAVKEKVREYFKDKMFDTSIRINTDIEKAQANGEDIFMFARNSHSALDYGKLSDEILKRLEPQTV